MRKIAFVLVMFLLLSAMAGPVSADDSRAIGAMPSLTFEGNVATCAFSATGNNISEHFEATIQLYRAGRVIATWEAEGNGYLFFSDTVTVARGYYYKMTVDLTVDGEPFAVPNVSKKCE